MKKSAITLSILASLYAGQVLSMPQPIGVQPVGTPVSAAPFTVQQEEPPVHPDVIEENEPDELDIVRDVDEQGSDLEEADYNLDMDISPMTLQEAIDAPSRRPQNRGRDMFRNPGETLQFFGIEPTMTVVEVWPGGGWYTEILAPFLAAEGSFYAAHFPAQTESDYFRTALGNYHEMLNTSNVYANVQVTEFDPENPQNLAPEGSADMVLTFRNLHNWYMNGGEEGLERAMQAFHQVLRPGGVLGVVDHRLPEDRNDEEGDESGYIKQSWVVEAAERAGFELEDESDINANPDDTADHEGGVWALPPTLSEGSSLVDIGESDRFTLKFRKPEE